MTRTSMGSRSAAAALAVVLLTPAVHAQAPQRGPATTPSGSYLNLQPRRRMPQPPLFAPFQRAAPGGDADRRDSRTVVCGMTVLTPPPGMDDAMVRPIAKDGPRPTMRAVDPPVCNPAR